MLVTDHHFHKHGNIHRNDNKFSVYFFEYMYIKKMKWKTIFLMISTVYNLLMDVFHYSTIQHRKQNYLKLADKATGCCGGIFNSPRIRQFVN